MDYLKYIYNKYLSKLNAYWVVVIAFVISTFMLGDSSLYKRYTYDEAIRKLERDIELKQADVETNRRKLEELRLDRNGLERFAREEYRMQLPDEDIFIIK